MVADVYPALVRRKWNTRPSSRWQQIDFLVSKQQAASYDLCVGSLLLHLLASEPDNVGSQRQEPEKLRVIMALRVHPHRHPKHGRGEAFVNKDVGQRIVVCLPTRQVTWKPDLTIIVKMLVSVLDPMKASAMITSAVSRHVSLQKQQEVEEIWVLSVRSSHLHQVSEYLSNDEVHGLAT